MKLSHKLLALSGVTLADYACCPYDDYGIPFSNCVSAIPEKTPFSDQPDWQNGACKSWEFNPDASFDGNDGACDGNNENWGSCGFQRHFPWSGLEQQSAYFGYHATAGDFGTNLVMDHAASGDASKFSIGGAPFLGGVCKLFIPVELENIESVSVAGVHLNPHFPHKAFDHTFASQDGSVHCFSVVNPSEALRSGGVHNGNVAGGATTGVTGGEDVEGDHFLPDTSLDRQDGQAMPFQWAPTATGQVTMGSNGGPGASGDSAVGQNFDVVVHINQGACRTHWAREDMQLAGDWGHQSLPANLGQEDYPYGAGDLTEHDHADTVEKRFAAKAAYDTVFTITDGYMSHSGDSDSGRWPNYGAYAAFYSFIACANVDDSAVYNANPYKYVFADFGDRVGCDPSGASPVESNACLAPRTIVPALGTNDYRTPDCTSGASTVLTYRSNVRQAGTDVVNCGPGEILDSDDKRCTWNWNFDGTAAHPAGFGSDPEDFFQRSESFDFLVWDETSKDHLTRTNAHNGKDTTDPLNNLATPIANVGINLAFRNHGGTNVCSTGDVLTFDVPAKYWVGASNAITKGAADCAAADFFIDGSTTDHNDQTYAKYTGTLTCHTTDVQDRDNFPDCYQGDEIHFSLAYIATDSRDGRLDPWRTVAKLTT